MMMSNPLERFSSSSRYQDHQIINEDRKEPLTRNLASSLLQIFNHRMCITQHRVWDFAITLDHLKGIFMSETL